MLNYIFSLLLLLTILGCQGGGDSTASSNAASSTRFLSVQSVINADTAISIKPKITLKFSAALDDSTINDTTAYIMDTDTNTPIGAAVKLLSDTFMIELTPYTYLKSNATYKIVVTTALKDIQGRSLSENYYFTFRTLNETRDTTPLTLRSIKPEPDSTDNLRDTNIVLDFSKSLSLEPKTYLKVQDANGNQIAGTTQLFNSLIIFKPTDFLPADSNITIELINAPKDIYGQSTYDINNANQWWFKTKTAQGSIDQNNTGFAVLDSVIGTNGSFDIKTFLDTNTNTSLSSFAVIASANKIELVDINYTKDVNGTTLLTKPTLSISEVYNTTESINSIAVNNMRIYAALANNMIVSINSLDTNSFTPAIQAAHPVYKLVMIDSHRLAALEPGYGFEVFSVDENGYLFLYKSVAKASSTYLDALQATGYDPDAQTDLTKIYLADYEGGVDIYDTNLTFLNRLDLNGSVKFLAKNEDSFGVNGLYAISASGKLQGFDFNGSISPYVKADLPARCYDIDSYIGDYMATYPSGIYYTLGDTGVYTYSTDYPQNKFHTGSEVIASTIVKNSLLKQPFLLSLDRSATIRISNLSNDSNAPYIAYKVPYNGGSLSIDGNVTVAFGDDYMDYTNVSAASFKFYDTNTSSSVPFTLSMDYNIEVGLTYVLVPDANLTNGHDYNITLNTNISDMVGNVLPQGSAITNFTATTN